MENKKEEVLQKFRENNMILTTLTGIVQLEDKQYTPDDLFQAIWWANEVIDLMADVHVELLDIINKVHGKEYSNYEEAYELLEELE